MDNPLLHHLTIFVFQLAVILVAAKIGGELSERYFKQPGVLGELIVGMIIGPFALGGYIRIPGLGPLFDAHTTAMPGSNVPVSMELYAIAQVAVLILLFMAGLETDLQKFIKYSGPATVVGVGGIVFPFIFGDVATNLIYYGGWKSFMDPTALFVGAIMTATSVGITARVLSDIKKLNTPEGVTVLAGAVIDDVLGILVLAIVIAIAGASQVGEFSWSAIGIIAAKAVGFWVALTVIGLALSKAISRGLRWFQSASALLGMGLALCFFVSALAETFKLAMIIGAYMIGLVLSHTEIADDLEEQLTPLNQALVPIFFVVMGMLVDFSAMKSVLWFGIVISALAIIGKVVGCGLPALGVGFNFTGAFRIGIGMLPRGEVALIIAGVGIAAGVIGSDIYGVSIMMTLITTLMAPVILVPLFKTGKSGVRGKTEEEKPAEHFEFKGDKEKIAVLERYFRRAFETAGYTETIHSHQDRHWEIYEFNRDGSIGQLRIGVSGESNVLAADIPNADKDLILSNIVTVVASSVGNELFGQMITSHEQRREFLKLFYRRLAETVRANKP